MLPHKNSKGKILVSRRRRDDFELSFFILPAPLVANWLIMNNHSHQEELTVIGNNLFKTRLAGDF
jgi:hypothetical protein